MEISARRRVSVLCSHFRSVSETTWRPKCLSWVSSSASDRITEKNQERNCVFCKIIRGEGRALKVYEDDICLCILDTNPLCHGHSLIIPRCHFSCLEATPPSVIGAMCSKVPLISNAIMKATGCDSFNLLINNGSAAGQVIFHTHIHIIPRKAHDCLWTTESLRRRPLKLDQEAFQLASNIRGNLSCADNFEDNKSQGSSIIEN